VVEEAKMIRGRFGDTHVAPAPLFDVSDSRASPPFDAHEGLSETPLVEGLLLVLRRLLPVSPGRRRLRDQSS